MRAVDRVTAAQEHLASEHVLRFDRDSHTYTIDGTEVPSITQMLERCGHTNEAFYTERSAERGHAVHQLCADYDHGAFHEEDLPSMTSNYKGWIVAYVKAMKMLRAQWVSIEEAFISARYRFGGRPDRLGSVVGIPHVLVDIKSGPPERWHAWQLAMQDILLSDAGDEPRLPIRVRQRYGLYLKNNGRFQFQPYDDARDYDVALDIIRRCRQ